ncbi:MAG: IS1 family transposase [Prevotellaceae bacterium]|nr:IS1 family transposase [Prevotellaceae bacterium]
MIQEVNYGHIVVDDWNSFAAAFKGENHVQERNIPSGTEGNNCRLRYCIRRAFRKTCCFSKNLFNHLKVVNPAFFYINFSFVYIAYFGEHHQKFSSYFSFY